MVVGWFTFVSAMHMTAFCISYIIPPVESINADKNISVIRPLKILSIPQCQKRIPILGTEEFQSERSWVPATPEKSPVLGRSIAFSDIQQGRQQVPLNSLELASNTGRCASNKDCLTQIFNPNSQVSQTMGYFRYSDEHSTEDNLMANGRAGSLQLSLPDAFVDFNNVSFMQLLQHGEAEVPSSNTTLLRFAEMAAETPSMPQPPHEMINIQQDCGSGGFNPGARFIDGMEVNQIGHSHWQFGKSSNPLNYGSSLPQTLGCMHPFQNVSFPCFDYEGKSLLVRMKNMLPVQLSPVIMGFLV
ncbi:hypothetical protein G4B88_019929 [Cannabis sativa]|uniref:Uncharacterized protein n=1 Tax=Cannabis sativa TaxID=3483 RepID=A0A7J6EB73_CANSA|nr:hypothetical protein G4B88_019929 [Cannabis sativa]